MGLVLVCLANMVDLLIVMRRFQSIFECYKRIRIDIMISPSKCVGLVADINYCNNICKLDSTTVNGFGFLSFDRWHFLGIILVPEMSSGGGTTYSMPLGVIYMLVERKKYFPFRNVITSRAMYCTRLMILW